MRAGMILPLLAATAGLGVAAGNAESDATSAVFRSEDEPRVVFLRNRNEWKRRSHGMKPSDALVNFYYTQYCRRCHGVRAKWEDAVNVFHQWMTPTEEKPQPAVNTTYFGEFDCSLEPQICDRMQIVRFPNIGIHERGGGVVALYGAGMQTVEDFLTWLAFHRRSYSPVPAPTKLQYFRNLENMLRSCTDPETPAMSFNASFCRAMTTRRFIGGTADVLDRVKRIFPLVETMYVLFEIPKPVKGSLESLDDACIIDDSGADKPVCITIGNRKAADIAAEGAEWMRDHQFKSFVPHGSWYGFLETRYRADSGSFLVAVAWKEDKELTAAVKEAVVSQGPAKSRKWSALMWDSGKNYDIDLLSSLSVESDVAEAVRNGSRSLVLAMHQGPASLAYYLYEGPATSAGVAEWMKKVDARALEARYPEGYEPGFVPWVKREWRTLKQRWSNFKNNIPREFLKWGIVRICAMAAMLIVTFYLTTTSAPAWLDKVNRWFNKPIPGSAAADAAEAAEKAAKAAPAGKSTGTEAAEAGEPTAAASPAEISGPKKSAPSASETSAVKRVKEDEDAKSPNGQDTSPTATGSVASFGPNAQTSKARTATVNKETSKTRSVTETNNSAPPAATAAVTASVAAAAESTAAAAAADSNQTKDKTA